MYYQSFFVKNYRGIKEIHINLDKKVLTLVGLNESGKTTILESIYWTYKCLKHNFPSQKDLNYFRPKGIKFSDSIIFETTIRLEKKDKELLNNFWHRNLRKKIPLNFSNEITYRIKFNFKKHEYINKDEEIKFDIYRKDNKNLLNKTNKKAYNSIMDFIRNELIPEIMYYDDFLFDIPDQIIYPLEDETDVEPKIAKLNYQWQKVLDDILKSVDKSFSSFKEDVIDKWYTDTELATQRINAMEASINNKISKLWKSLFKTNKPHFKEIKLIPLPSDKAISLSFKIRSEKGLDFSINDRSKGFKWFFAFLIFTEFRKLRSKNILFLLDEPASNLHSYAQEKILTAMKSLTKESFVIYSTHSLHLINPKWLSGTYIVINETITDKRLKGDITFEEGASITAEPFFKYVSRDEKKHINLSYLQPILDRLEYIPPKLFPLPPIVITEGRDDWFILNYFKEYVFKEKYELNFYPGKGASQLDQIIRLYLSWGEPFLVILDGDKEGEKNKNKYLKEFNHYIQKKIFTLNDVFQKPWTIENLISKEDKEKLINIALEKNKLKRIKNEKYIIHLGIRILLQSNKSLKFDKSTSKLFEKLFKFLTKKIKNDK